MKLAILASAMLIAHVSAKCENGCSGHGSCGTGSKCNCYAGFIGSDCSLRTCYYANAWVDTAVGDINGDGEVSMDLYLNDETGYSSEMYSANYGQARPISFVVNNETGLTPQQEGWDEAHFYMECSNKGLCNRKTGQCDCFPGYDGEGCQRTTCPGVTEKGKACSGHGTCVSSFADVKNYRLWDKQKTFKCKCDPAYMGSDCSSRKCPMEADPQQHQLVYTSSLQKIAWASFAYHYSSTTASKREVVSRIVDGDVSFTITVQDHFGDSWTTNAFTMKYNTRVATIGGNKVIFNYPTSYEFEAQKLASNGNVFEKASTSLVFTKNTKVGETQLHSEVKSGLESLPHGACRDAMVWTQFVQRQGKTIEDFSDLTKVTSTNTGCYSDVNTPVSRTVNDKYVCEYPAGAWDGSKCSNHNFTTKAECVSMGFQIATADKTLDPYSSLNNPNIVGMDKRVDQAMPIFVKGTTTEDTIYSPYQCGRTTTVHTTAAGTGIVRRDGACIYIQTSNKVNSNYVVTYSYNSQLRSDVANWPSGKVYTAKKIIGRSAAEGMDVRDFTGKASDITNTLVRVTDVSAHRRVQTQWVDGIFPISNGKFGQAKSSTTSQIYPLRESLFLLSSCSSRGLCNDNTGECDCFKGYVGSACTRQKSVSFVA